jgi:UDP-2,4-diacetamido-2,4,6-trideoxy-beta-L-altropyranose hydrolase
MQVVFRCDADTRIGTGHLRRCLTLADALREAGADCLFLSRAAMGGLREKILAGGHRLHDLDLERGASESFPGVGSGDSVPYSSWLPWDWQEDLRLCLRRLGGQQADWLVADHYALDARWESGMRAVAGRVLAIDDLANRPHDCDLLLDANFGRSPVDYARLAPPSARMLLGSRHVLLRPEFVRRRARGLPSRRPIPERVFVNMGGSDPGNASSAALRVMQSIECTHPPEITVVLGAGAPWIESVRSAIAASRWPARLLVDPPDMAELMASSDMAIGSGGTGVYERLYLRLPSLVTPIADNQREALGAMAAAGLFRMYDGDAGLGSALRDALEEGVAVPADVVGNGVPIVCREMSAGGLLLVKPGVLDVRRTHRWLQDPALRRDFLMRERPRRRQHFAFWRHLLVDPKQHVFAIYAGGRHVGNAGIRNIRGERSEGELWLYLGDSSDRGRGLGRRSLMAIEDAMRSMGLRRADLHVDRANDAACALYTAAGYRPVPRSPGGPIFEPDVQRMEKEL